MILFFKEGNKLVGSSSYLEWKKRIDLFLIENEVSEFVTRSISKPSQEKSETLSNYMKGEIRA